MFYRFRSVGTQIAAPTFEQIAKAQTLSSIDDIINANTQIDKYQFEENADLTKALQVVKVVVTPSKLDNGNITNNATIELKDGRKLFANVFGAKGVPMDKIFEGNDIKTLKYGFCKSGGEYVAKTKVNPATGELNNVRTIYVKVA